MNVSCYYCYYYSSPFFPLLLPLFPVYFSPFPCLSYFSASPLFFSLCVFHIKNSGTGGQASSLGSTSFFCVVTMHRVLSLPQRGCPEQPEDLRCEHIWIWPWDRDWNWRCMWPRRWGIAATGTIDFCSFLHIAVWRTVSPLPPAPFLWAPFTQFTSTQFTTQTFTSLCSVRWVAESDFIHIKLCIWRKKWNAEFLIFYHKTILLCALVILFSMNYIFLSLKRIIEIVFDALPDLYPVVFRRPCSAGEWTWNLKYARHVLFSYLSRVPGLFCLFSSLKSFFPRFLYFNLILKCT